MWKWLLAAFTLCALSAPVGAEVRVADVGSMFVPGGTHEIGPGRYHYSRLPEIDRAKYKVRARASGDLRFLLCDGPSFRRFRAGQPHRCVTEKREGRLSLSAPASPRGPMYLVVENENVVVSKTARWRTQVVFPMPSEPAREMRTSLQRAMDRLHYGLDVPAFDLTVQPCGQVNAYSKRRSGDITLCTELMFSALREGSRGAVAMVIFHELGHSLLNLWGEPNYANERTADEFATVFALMGGQQQLVRDWLGWFQANKNLAGEIRAAREGDLHMLTPQRVEAIRRVLERPGPTIRRWTRTIYPHMTDAGLRSVLDQGHPGANPALARQLLRERSAG